MAQEATPPPLCSSAGIWSLITGPEASNWSRLLVCDHLDSRTRRALFSTCKAASNTVLVSADHAWVFLCPDDYLFEPSEDDEAEQPREEELVSLDRLRAIRAALQTRGRARTKLTLVFPTVAMLTFALGVLEAGTTWLDELIIGRCYTTADEQLPVGFLASVGRCCPNLRALGLPPGMPHGMPSHQLFPKLEQLSIYYMGDGNLLERVYSSVAPYVKQLTNLTLESSTPPLPTHLPLVITPGSTTTRLRFLHIHATLDDAALGVLLQCAPALQDLRVSEVRLQSAAHAQVQTQWRQLSTEMLHLSSLARLPLAAGSLQIHVPGPGSLVCDIIAGSEAAHLKGAHLDGIWASIKPGVDLRVEDQAAALRTCLSLLRACPPKAVASPELHGWQMSRDVLLELRHLPQYPTRRLTFADDLVWLPQPAHLYSTLLRLLPDSVQERLIYRGAQAGRLTNAQLETICLGAPTTRSAQGRLLVTLPCCLPPVMRQRMKGSDRKWSRALTPNVTIVAQ